MSKTNTEKMAPETQTPEMTNGMKLDVRVRPIADALRLTASVSVPVKRGCMSICPQPRIREATGKMSAGRLRQSSASSSTMPKSMGTGRLLKICRQLLKRQREQRKTLP